MNRKEQKLIDVRTGRIYPLIRRGDPKLAALESKRQMMRRGAYPTGEICAVTMLPSGAFIPLYDRTKQDLFDPAAPREGQTLQTWDSKPRLKFLRANGTVRQPGEARREPPRTEKQRDEHAGSAAAGRENVRKKRVRPSDRPLPHYMIREEAAFYETVEAMRRLDPEKTLFIDLEMTGVCAEDEPLSVSIVDGVGRKRFDSLVRPVHVTDWSFTVHIHHITQAMVEDAPTLDDLSKELRGILRGAEAVIGYGVGGDWQILRRVCGEEQAEMDRRVWCCHEMYCAFLRYLPSGGEPSTHTNLKEAMAHFGLSWRGEPHSSLADAYACGSVWQAVLDQTAQAQGSGSRGRTKSASFRK